MPERTPILSVVFFAIAALLGAIGQYLYKEGAGASDGTLRGYVLNLRVHGGVICYVAVMVLFLAAFRRGGSLTVLYPVYATTFIWAAFIALWAYGTPIRPVHVAGMTAIGLGLYLLGR